MHWLDTFLPRLCCPHTRQPLRLATDGERRRAGIADGQSALINESGTHVYPIVEDIPHLLPGSAVELKAQL